MINFILGVITGYYIIILNSNLINPFWYSILKKVLPFLKLSTKRSITLCRVLLDSGAGET